jgi:hypothetical protein
VSEEYMEIAKATMREMQSENPEAVDELREKVLRRIEEMGEKPRPPSWSAR